ncbi:mediator of RNA polymerase II transcription subunit 28 isoform X2 [Drosophila tropicalis]|uniref:mediator of RNA polymerase II transcription subunit 28 isoform X2 n=1 Tax=Drosophila tropicalis TaxID=46794 RepID=UPI0035ABA9C5
MSSNEAGSGNLMDDFEEAFQTCLLALTKQEPNSAFFLQKRFLVSTLKPHMLIKDENQDLHHEIQRKDALLQKHYNRLEEWKACLSDIQQGGHSRPSPSIMQIPGGPIMPQGGPRPGMMGPGMPPGGMSPSQQQLLQAQQMQQLRMMGKLPPK